MGVRYFLGASATRCVDTLLGSRHFPLTRYVPYGISWTYDLQRFLGTRSLGAVFDVGANTGQTVRGLLRYAPDAEIYCFEPGTMAFEVLRATLGSRRNVHLFNAALGARAEKLPLQVRDDTEANTLVAAGSRGAVARPTQIVDVMTVDDVVAANHLSHLSLLKIDVQGWETEVMRGASTLIANDNLMFVFAEVAFRADETEMHQFGELHDHLEKNGFVLCGFYEPLRYGPRREFVLFCNALYLSPKARLKWTDMRAEWDRWMALQKPKPAS